ncbi:N-acetyltransferase NAT13 [Flagelloscypha sp. PMI_526]|nr:N-acetyltransferase NAT13 [Flagelloscypha sp. PMI_526]
MGSVSRVSFASLTPNNIGTVRKLNSVLFPVKYSDKFYEQILSPQLEEFCQLVYYNDVPVGIVCARLEQKDGLHVLYVMTMGVLAPYRSRKLGSQTLEHILTAAQAHSKPSKIDKVSLHVQTSNTDAKRFYERHGFKENGVQENYYKKITPHDAWILEKDLRESSGV